MNEQTTKLIEQLANQLGTTSEYLWSVLLKQASITATTTLIQTIIVLLIGFVLYGLHKKFSKKTINTRSSYEEHDFLGFTMVVVTIIYGLFLICCFLYIPEIIYGYFNPEYWALNRILEILN